MKASRPVGIFDLIELILAAIVGISIYNYGQTLSHVGYFGLKLCLISGLISVCLAAIYKYLPRMEKLIFLKVNRELTSRHLFVGYVVGLPVLAITAAILGREILRITLK